MKRVLLLVFLSFSWFTMLFAGAGKERAPVEPLIGILKFFNHDALDDCERGIVEALRIRGINARFDQQNAGGDPIAAERIADRFHTENVQIAVGISTAAASALARNIHDVPVIFAAVTDPVGAGLVSSLGRREGNITGLSDAISIANHIIMFKEIAAVKTLGYIYNSHEPKAAAALAEIKQACEKHGLGLVTMPISSSLELRQAAQSMVRQVDGIYVSADKSISTAMPVLIDICRQAKKPLFTADMDSAMGGGCVIAAGFNYYQAGIAAGNMIAEVLDGKRPADMPIRFLTRPDESNLLFDLDAALNCGITIPAKYLFRASYIYEHGALNGR